MTQLYDYLGRTIKPPAKPDTREIAGAVSLRDRWSSYPSRGLTPSRLAQIFEAADNGDLRAQAEMFAEMRQKDPHLYSVTGTRRLAVLGLEWQVEDASEDAQDKRIAEFCREQLKSLKIKALLKHLLGAVGYGYAAAELLWQTGEQTAVSGFRAIHPKNITFLNSLTPRVVTEGNWQGVEPEPFKLAFHLYEAESGHDTPSGVFRVCAYMYLFKNYALKDWAAFNEIFGMPLRLGKYDPSATTADKEVLRMAIASLGSDAAGIISKATEIEFIEAGQRLSGTTNPYQVMADFCNREMSKAVLGQTLTTDTTGATGTYSAGKVQEEVRTDLLEADAEALAETIKSQILLPLVGFNFGWDAAQKGLPGFALMLQEEQDLESDSKVIKNLTEAGAGSCIPKSHINKHFAIPEPKKGEETLETPAPTPPEPPGNQPPGQPPQALKAQAGPGLELLPQDARVIAAQVELEHLTQAALAASEAAAALTLRPVVELIARAESLSEISAGILDIFPDLDVRGQAEILSQAMILAELQGRRA